VAIWLVWLAIGLSVSRTSIHYLLLESHYCIHHMSMCRSAVQSSTLDPFVLCVPVKARTWTVLPQSSVTYNGQTVPICEDAFFFLPNCVQRYARHDRGSLSSRKGTLKGVPYFEQLCFLAYRHRRPTWSTQVILPTSTNINPYDLLSGGISWKSFWNMCL
jgi:hypothetical protein